MKTRLPIILTRQFLPTENMFIRPKGTPFTMSRTREGLPYANRLIMNHGLDHLNDPLLTSTFRGDQIRC